MEWNGMGQDKIMYDGMEWNGMQWDRIGQVKMECNDELYHLI